MSLTGSMRSEPLHPAELGATLFIPASHSGLCAVLSGTKYPALRSTVVDFEDGIDPAQHETALEQFAALLCGLTSVQLLRFVRPDSPSTLLKMLKMPHIDRIDGFVLPKFGLDNATAWLEPFQHNTYVLMPSLEGTELFCDQKIADIAAFLLPYRSRIPVVRFGLEDMFRHLGLSRTQGNKLKDIAAVCTVIGRLVTMLKPLGFSVSGGVYKFYRDADGLRNEAVWDLQQGLLGKTIIHPSQIEVIEAAYRVPAAEFERARRIKKMHGGVCGMDGTMLEPATQRPWAHTILKRAELYGVTEQ